MDEKMVTVELTEDDVKCLMRGSRAGWSKSVADKMHAAWQEFYSLRREKEKALGLAVNDNGAWALAALNRAGWDLVRISSEG